MYINTSNKDHKLSQYHGKGYLVLQGGYHAACTFYACQFINGRIEILCKFNSLDLAFLVNRRSAVRFEGETSDGFFIYGSGDMHYSKGELGSNSSATYLISELYVTRNENTMANKLVFGLTNLELDGRKHKLELKNNQDGENEYIKIGLVPVKNYALIINQLEHLNGINVTYQAIIEVTKKEDSWIFRKLVEDLCYLFSVAQGSKIQWIYLNRIDDNRIVSCLHSNRPTKRYNPSALIDAQDIEKFIECVYPTYEKKRMALKLDKGLLDAYLDAQSQEDYIETRAAKLAVTIEMLKATLLELPEYELHEYLLNKDFFKNQIAPSALQH